jgi:hypothetical protein
MLEERIAKTATEGIKVNARLEALETEIQGVSR